MNDLLQKAVDAHGGLKRWNKISCVTVAASLTGAIWFVKSQGDYLKNVVMTVDTRKEQMTTDFPGQDKRFLFTPERLVMEKRDGTLLLSGTIPRSRSRVRPARLRGTTSTSHTSRARRCGPT